MMRNRLYCLVFLSLFFQFSLRFSSAEWSWNGVGHTKFDIWQMHSLLMHIWFGIRFGTKGYYDTHKCHSMEKWYRMCASVLNCSRIHTWPPKKSPAGQIYLCVLSNATVLLADFFFSGSLFVCKQSLLLVVSCWKQ